MQVCHSLKYPELYAYHARRLLWYMNESLNRYYFCYRNMPVDRLVFQASEKIWNMYHNQMSHVPVRCVRTLISDMV